MFDKISIKVAVMVNVALFVVIVAGGYYIANQQGESLEQQFLELLTQNK